MAAPGFLAETLDDPALAVARAEPLRAPPSRGQWIFGAVLGACLLAYPLVFDQPYQQHVLIMIFIYALMAQGWNVLAGYCGQISLGQAVFFGIGAYSAAFLFSNFHVSPWLGMAVGVVVSMAVALLIGLPTFRLKGHYFAIAYVTVAMGGFGSLIGALVAGVIIGLVEALGGLLIDPAFKYVIVFVMYLGIVLVRPKGLFGRY